jgi:hypothetical protein
MIMFLIFFSYIVIVGGIIGYIAEDFISDRFGEPVTIIFVLVSVACMSLGIVYMFG